MAQREWNNMVTADLRSIDTIRELTRRGLRIQPLQRQGGTRQGQDTSGEGNTTTTQVPCYLLDLPFEIRSKIYAFVLPMTIDVGSKGVVWRRGNITLLATNKQIYKEATSQLYGHNVFLIDVVWDCSTFFYPTELLPNVVTDLNRQETVWPHNPHLPNSTDQEAGPGLSEAGSRRRMAFPDQLALRNVKLMRKFYIKVYITDSYAGVMEGLGDQVRFLCQTLSSVPEIGLLHIHLQDDTHDVKVGDKILEPFFKLQHVRRIKCSGDMSSETLAKLQKTLPDTYERASLLRLPPEVRDMIYVKVLPINVTNWEQGKPRSHSWKKVASGLSLCFANKLIYSETMDLLYHTLPFQLICLPSGEYRFYPEWQLQPKKPRFHPGSAFPQSISPTGFRFIRELSINVGPYTHADKNLRAQLDHLFSKLESMVCDAEHLHHLNIQYGVGRSYDGILTPRMELTFSARLAKAAKAVGKTVKMSAVKREGDWNRM